MSPTSPPSEKAKVTSKVRFSVERRAQSSSARRSAETVSATTFGQSVVETTAADALMTAERLLATTQRHPQQH